MSDVLVPPAIAALDGDAQDLHIGRLEDQEYRLDVASAGAEGILIDDDLAFGRHRGRRESEDDSDEQEPPLQATHDDTTHGVSSSRSSPRLARRTDLDKREPSAGILLIETCSASRKP